ncbi:Iron-uptake system permease protein FeuC [compost metagenome]
MLLVILADYIGKNVVSPAEVPVGIVIAIIGVPYFVTLLMKRPAYRRFEPHAYERQPD